MSKKPPKKRNQPKSAKGAGKPPKNDTAPRKGRHTPTPSEDAEWEKRMDELEDERADLNRNEVAQPVAIDPHELASIVKRLEALRATSKELGQEGTPFNAHIDEALLHLNQAASELVRGDL
jgi:hypothetical protein